MQRPMLQNKCRSKFAFSSFSINTMQTVISSTHHVQFNSPHFTSAFVLLFCRTGITQIEYSIIYLNPKLTKLQKEIYSQLIEYENLDNENDLVNRKHNSKTSFVFILFWFSFNKKVKEIFHDRTHRVQKE